MWNEMVFTYRNITSSDGSTSLPLNFWFQASKTACSSFVTDIETNLMITQIIMKGKIVSGQSNGAASENQDSTRCTVSFSLTVTLGAGIPADTNGTVKTIKLNTLILKFFPSTLSIRFTTRFWIFFWLVVTKSEIHNLASSSV